MQHDDPDDDPTEGTAPLPPDDRLWRHPSEIAAAGRAASQAGRSEAGPTTPAPPAPPATRPGRGRSVWAVAAVAGVAGATVAVTAMAITGSLSPRVVEKRATTPVRAVLTDSATPKTVTALTAEAAAFVARVAVVRGGQRSNGSAVVVRADGVLVTSARLVADADQVEVRLPDGRLLPATVVGLDTGRGVGVLRVKATGLSPAPVSGHVAQPGELALAVAASDSSTTKAWVSSGVISSVGRTVTPEGQDPLWGMIETDRPIPDSGDGGALVDHEGSVAGVCVSVDGAGDGAPTSGYAVPIGTAAAVAFDLVDGGEVRTAWAGIEAVDLTAEDAFALGITGGARVAAVVAAGPADRAGLRVGDVVVAAAGVSMRSTADLVRTLQSHRPGEQVELAVRRDGTEVALLVDLTEKP